MKIQLLKVAKFYRRLYGDHTNVCKFSQLCGAISSLAKDVSLSIWQCCHFKALFSVVSTEFP